MESKKICFVFAQQEIHELWVQCGLPPSFHSWNGLLFQHGGVQGKHYTLIDLPLYGAQIEPRPIFVAHEL